MAARKKIRRAEAQLGFDALYIEGGLLSPEWLAKVAQLSAGSQTEADYRVEKGLNLRDEIGRYWRIAQAYWREFATGRSRSLDKRGLAEHFVESLLRKSFEFGSLRMVPPVTLGDRVFPIGHAALDGRVPVVIAPAGFGLDKLPDSAGEGGRRRSAFGLAQEYLNAQEGALWGIVSDGCTLRILRDNASLTRPAWVEADLERIFTEERYADFAALWLLIHETRFGKPGQPVTDCALETWRNAGREEGTRAREFLRRGVEEALSALGQGFLSHPSNQALRSALQDGSLSTRELFQQLLRLVYRLIFLLTVEERGLLHPEGVPEATRKLYEDGYSLRQLRERSARRSAHDRFSDRWEAVKIVFRGLAQGEPRLGLPALAGLFAPHQCAAIDAARLENRALLLAMFRLSWLRNESGLARVNWRDMGPEELGSVYESLLELVPQITDQGRRFAFATGGETKGNARKTSGSYYTPDSLVQVLLDSALEPVVADALAAAPRVSVGAQDIAPSVAGSVNPPISVDSAPNTNTQGDGLPSEDPPAVLALLSLSVVDPACGSGHFLLGAARRLAVHVARLRANGTPSASEYRKALRDVVRRCIYGVDLNPMAVELCKVSLWMEALEPGLPLTFLDSHIQQGNSLLGTTPALMEKGIPDAAWEAIEGDDKKIASALKKRNKKAAGGQRGLDFGAAPGEDETKAVVREAKALEGTSDETAEALARKENRWGALLESPEFRHQKLVADAWCAAFVWPKQPGELAEVAPTNEVWRQFRDAQGKPPALLEKTVRELAAQYQFFHWHLRFPQVFERGGFDVVLGNPPWVAHAGKAAQPLPLGVKLFFGANYESFADYPTTHGIFVGHLPCVLKLGGLLGLIIPSSISELGGYTPTRSAHDKMCCFPNELRDFGEGQFLGVTQPCMALVSQRTTTGRVDAEFGSPWPMSRPDLTEIDRKILLRLSDFATLPPELFGERGVQSDKAILVYFNESEKPVDRFDCPIREGSDVREFFLISPRLHVDRDALGNRIRSSKDFQSVRIVIRQTARYPIAALSDGVAFRNSLLAGFESEEWPCEALVALLNSSLIRWQHYMRFRVARQPVMPQVTIGHLRSIPVPPSGLEESINALRVLGLQVTRDAKEGRLNEQVRRDIDNVVFAMYGLHDEEIAAVSGWHEKYGPHEKVVKRSSPENDQSSQQPRRRGRPRKIT